MKQEKLLEAIRVAIFKFLPIIEL